MSGNEKSQEAGHDRHGRDAKSRSKRGHLEESKSSRRHKRKRSRERSVYEEDRYHKRSHAKRYHREERQDDRDQKIDEIFDWMKASKASRSRRRSYSRSSRSDDFYYERRSGSKANSIHSHDISFDSRSVRSVVVLVHRADGTQRDLNIDQGEVDSLTARLNTLRAEGLPKPVTGPGISEDLAPVLNVFLAKSEFAKTMSVCEKYPRPSNIDNLSIPELPRDANRIIDGKVVKSDERMMNDQKCTVALFGALGKSLDMVLKLKDKCPELVEVGDMLLDGLQMTGFLHQDFTTLRLKGFKQTVNPSYGDVVSQKPEEPGMLLGKTPLGEQMKSCEELNKLKAKFKKPEQHAPNMQRRDFRKGGEYKGKQQFKPNNRRRNDRKTRYYSPKGSYRKGQQETAHRQEEKQNQPFRKN